MAEQKESEAGVMPLEPSFTECLRQGQVECVNQDLIKILCQEPFVMIIPEREIDEDPDDLRTSSGILVSVCLSVPFWLLAGLMLSLV
jgi:hypothetical protein